MKRLACLFVLILCACGDTIAPECNARYACETTGVDLALVSVKADSAVGTYVSTPVLDANNLHVTFVAVNRGDRASSSGARAVISAFGAIDTVNVPVIAPGDSAVVRAPITIGRSYLYGGVEDEARNLEVRVLDSDADTASNTLLSVPYALDLPYWTLTARMDTTQTVRLGEFIRVSWTLRRGYMSGVASNESVSVLICLRLGTRTCTQGNWQALQRRDPTSTGSQSASPFIVANAVASPAAGSYDALICIVPRTHAGMYVEPANPDHHCEQGGKVIVR